MPVMCQAHQILHFFIGCSVHDSMVMAVPPFPAKLPHITGSVLCGPFILAIPTFRRHFAGFDKRADKGEVMGPGNIPFVGRGNDSGFIVPHISIPINNSMLPLTIIFGSSIAIFGSSSVKVPTYNWIFGYDDNDIACTITPWFVSLNVSCWDWFPLPTDIAVSWSNVQVGVTWADVWSALIDYAVEIAFAALGRYIGGSPDEGMSEAQKAARKNFKAQKADMKFFSPKKLSLSSFDTGKITKEAFDADMASKMAKEGLKEGDEVGNAFKLGAKKRRMQVDPEDFGDEAADRVRYIDDLTPEEQFAEFQKKSKRTWWQMMDADDGVEGMGDEYKRNAAETMGQEMFEWFMEQGFGIATDEIKWGTEIGHPVPVFEPVSVWRFGAPEPAQWEVVEDAGGGLHASVSPVHMKLSFMKRRDEWADENAPEGRGVKDLQARDIQAEGCAEITDLTPTRSDASGQHLEYRFSAAPCVAQGSTFKFNLAAAAGKKDETFAEKAEEFWTFWRARDQGGWDRFVHHEDKHELRYPNKAAQEVKMTWAGQGPTLTLGARINLPTKVDPVPMYAQFSDGVTGFTSAEISATGGQVANFVQISPERYEFELVPDSDEADLTVSVAKAVAHNSQMQGNFGSSFTASYVNTKVPTTITPLVSSPTSQSPLSMRVTFGREVTALSQVHIQNAGFESITPMGPSTEYVVTMTPTVPSGDVTLTIRPGFAHDHAGNPCEGDAGVVTFDPTVAVQSPNGAYMTASFPGLSAKDQETLAVGLDIMNA